MKAKSIILAIVQGATLGILLSVVVILARVGTQIAVLGPTDIWNGEITILSLPTGYLQYDGRTGYSFAQRDLAEFTLPLLAALAGVAIALWRQRAKTSAEVQ